MKFLLLFFVIYSTSAKLSEDYIVVEQSNQLEDAGKTYAPTWKDLDTRPLPEWYDKAKIGIFMHWGVYSVPSFGSEWFWSNWKLAGDNKTIEFMNKNYPPGFTYQDFAPMFTAEFFDPIAWASLFSKAGAKYVILTSKHHEGYTLFPSRRSFSWNAMDVGPKRDLVGEIAQAVRQRDLKFGVYHSLYEWFNPIYLEDKKALYLTQNYPMTKLWPDLKQIVYDYEPSVIWSDGDWEAFDAYWNSTDLLAWLYNESPVKDEIVVNDRWGIGIPCHHGDFYNCADRYNPGKLQNHKWENAFTVDSKSWGYRRNMALHEILTNEQLLKEVVSTVSCGGNALINIGPTKEGTIAPIFQERLLTLGHWLSINGEGIYATSPWVHQNDTYNPDVWYTCTKQEYNAERPTSRPAQSDVITAVYAIFLRWPRDSLLKVRDVAPYLHTGTYKVQLLGNEGNLNVSNALINIGPTKEGTIAPIFQERLLTLGHWLSINGEGIYATSPWVHQNDTYNPDVWYTCTKQEYNAKRPTSRPAQSDVITAVYAIFLRWPRDSLLKVRDVAPYLHTGTYKVQLLGNEGNLNWKIYSGLAIISLPDKVNVVSKHAWTLKLTQK